MGKTAREVMSGGAECIGENDTLAAGSPSSTWGRCRAAARTTASKGMLTDRDIGADDSAEDKVGDLVEAISAAP